MSLIRWNALRNLADLEREMLGTFDYPRFRRQEEGKAVDFLPSADILENENGYTIKLDLPGVAKEDVKVDLTENVLTIQGEKKAGKEMREGSCHCSERHYGTFFRSFSLPGNVESGKVKAEFRDGVLTLEIPKSEKAKARQIEIQ